MHETTRAAGQPEAAGGNARDKGLPAPAALTDGAYRLVSSIDQMTGEGRIFYRRHRRRGRLGIRKKSR